MYRFTCPNCAKNLGLTSQPLTPKIRCPACKEIVTLPGFTQTQSRIVGKSKPEPVEPTSELELELLEEIELLPARRSKTGLLVSIALLLLIGGGVGVYFAMEKKDPPRRTVKNDPDSSAQENQPTSTGPTPTGPRPTGPASKENPPPPTVPKQETQNERVTRLLNDPEKSHRIDCIRELAADKERSQFAIPALLARLQTPQLDLEEEKEIYDTLFKVSDPDPSMIPALIQALKSSSASAQLYAATAFAVCFPLPNEHSDVIEKMLSHPSPKLRDVSMLVLVKMGPAKRAKALAAVLHAHGDEIEGVRESAAELLQQLAPLTTEDLKTIEENFQDLRPAVRNIAYLSAIRMNPPKADSLRIAKSAIVINDPIVQSAGLELIARLGKDAEAFVDIVVELTRHPNGAVRRSALSALPQVDRSVNTLRTLTAALSDTESEVRETVLNGLEGFPLTLPNDRPILESLLRSTEVRAKIVALKALNSLEHKAEPMLKQIADTLDHPNVLVKELAVKALTVASPQRPPELLAKVAEQLKVPLAVEDTGRKTRSRLHNAVFEYLEKSARDALPIYFSTLKNPELTPYWGIAMAQAAQVAGPKEAVELGNLVVPLLAQDAHKDDAMKCLELLGEQAVPALIAGTNHRNRPIQLASVTMLGVLGPKAKAALPRLAQLRLERDDLQLRKYAAEAYKNVSATK